MQFPTENHRAINCSILFQI